jgi:hypothetical protein
MEFYRKCDIAKLPLGVDPLAAAMKLATTEPPPKEAEQFSDSPTLRTLVCLCWQLARLNVEGPGVFYLPCDRAAKLTGVESITVNRFLSSLCSEGCAILELVTPGTRGGPEPRRKASRYRWVGS